MLRGRLVTDLRKGVCLSTHLRRISRLRYEAEACIRQYTTGPQYKEEIVRIVVPAFFAASSPTDLGPHWRAVERAGKEVRIAVPEYSLSQVDPVGNPDLWNTAKQQFNRCRNKGQRILGYVSTQNGNRPRQQIDADLDAWYDRYPAQLDGIFLDEGPVFDDSRQAFYVDLINHIKQTYPGRRTVLLNAAQFPNKWVVEVADHVILWEETRDTYRDENKYQAIGPGGQLVGVPRWWKSPELTNRITHIVHTCQTARQMVQVVQLARRRNAGNVYVFDGNSSGYDRLPSYWREEREAVAS
jgi:hypothetical protein